MSFADKLRKLEGKTTEGPLRLVPGDSYCASTLVYPEAEFATDGEIASFDEEADVQQWLLFRHCAPEIMALVEKIREEHTGACPVCDALDALDAKAEEMK